MKPFPKRARTLSKKIRLDNPWNMGKELGDLIDLNWDTLKQTNSFEVEWFYTLAKKHHLSSSYVIDMINHNYL